jgi:RimJ/RimL family protein N-acetyltransferase
MILGENIRLRAIEREDIPRFVRWLNDPEVIEFLLMNSPLSRAVEEQWFNKQVSTPAHESQVFAIEILINDEWVHIGNAGLHSIEPVHLAAEFGIFIGEKSFWNKGYGREAARLTLKHGFDNLNLNRIYLYVYKNNPRGIKAYESVGFVKEGEMREAVYKNGRYLNVLLMSILHSEWKEKN